MLFRTSSVFYRRTAFALACTLGLNSCVSHTSNTNARLALQNTLVKDHPELSAAFLPSENPDEQFTQPLTPELAITRLMQASPQVQMELGKLGLADAQSLQASLLSNPRLSFSILKPDRGDSWLWDFGLSQSLKDFFMRPLREQQANGESLNTQLDVSRQLQTLIGELQHDYFSALAAQQAKRLQDLSVDTATAKKELAASLYKAGNISELSYLGYAADLQEQQLLQISHEKTLANCLAKLGYLLDLPKEQIHLPDSLPALPEENFDVQGLTAEAINTRFDLQLLKQQLAMQMSQLELTKREYGIRDSNIGIAAQRDSDGTRSRGPQLELNIPVFDRGQAKVTAIQQQQFISQAEIKDRELNIALNIRTSIINTQSARQEFAQLETSISLNGKRQALAQREVNFMLRSPFELIDSKAKTLQLQIEQSNALLAYWHARSQLEFALGKQLPLAEQTPTEPVSSGADKSSGEHKHD